MWALLLQQQQQQQRKEIILLDQAMQKIIQAIYDKNRRKVEVKPNEKLEKTKLMENLKGRFKFYIYIFGDNKHKCNVSFVPQGVTFVKRKGGLNIIE